MLDKACFELKQEGIMIKQADSPYVVNERKEKWLKLKPDMLENFGDDLDLIILGGYYGRGDKRGGYVAEFLLGVPIAGSPEHPHKFHSFCKVHGPLMLSVCVFVALALKSEPHTDPSVCLPQCDSR